MEIDKNRFPAIANIAIRLAEMVHVPAYTEFPERWTLEMLDRVEVEAAQIEDVDDFLMSEDCYVGPDREDINELIGDLQSRE